MIFSDGHLFVDLDNGTNRIRIETPSIDYQDGSYHSFVFSFDGSANQSGMKGYVDGSLVVTGTSTALSGSIKNTNTLAFGAGSTGTKKFTGTMALSMILKEEVDATWVTGFNNGFFDWSGGNQITCIPFTGNEDVWAEATSPFCVSS